MSPMHPRQAQLLATTSEILTAAKKPVALGSPSLWKYTDSEGKEFFLSEKLRNVHSPFTGKTFPAKPEKHTPSDVGKELREEAKDPAASPGPKTGGPKGKKKASDDWKVASLDSHKIQKALAMVHETEKHSQNPMGKGRAEAVKEAIAAEKLSPEEASILMNATHVKPSEIE